MNLAFNYFSKSAPDILEFGLLLIFFLLLLLGIERLVYHLKKKISEQNSKCDESALTELHDELKESDTPD